MIIPPADPKLWGLMLLVTTFKPQTLGLEGAPSSPTMSGLGAPIAPPGVALPASSHPRRRGHEDGLVGMVRMRDVGRFGADGQWSRGHAFYQSHVS